MPSSDDLEVFTWITQALDADDLPAVMIIVGDDGASVFIGSMSRDGPFAIVMIGDLART
jgi:hypothetical protein